MYKPYSTEGTPNGCGRYNNGVEGFCFVPRYADKAISIVSGLKNVYVLDRNGIKGRFPYGVYKEMVHLLSN